MQYVEVTYSRGRGRSGTEYAYLRPAGKCFNRSRRVRADRVDSCMKIHFPHINYYLVDGHVIGAKDENFALREYWRVCERNKIGKQFPVSLITI